MKCFGKLLKEERVLRGISLEEVSDYTKISLRYLKAIEEDDLKSLPAATFVRGFLKSYAKFVGLNTEQVVFNFDQFEKLTSKDVSSSPLQISPIQKKGIKFLLVFIAILTPLLTLALGYSFHDRGEGPLSFFFSIVKQSFKEGESGEESPTEGVIAESQAEANPLWSDNLLQPDLSALSNPLPQLQKTEVALKEDIILIKPAETLSDLEGTLSLAKNGEAYPGQNPNISLDLPINASSLQDEVVEHTLEITSIDKVWLRVSSDNRKVFEGILEPPATKIWQAKEKFTLSVGNAGGVELKLDNQKLPTLGKKGEVITGITLPKITLLPETVKNKSTSNVLE